MGTIELDRDFSEFIASFNAHEVRYLIVGGYALAAHGLPRATGDLDAWIWVEVTNAQRVLAALEDFGFAGLGLTAEDFRQAGRVVQLGYPPYRIDILTDIDGVRFTEAWPRRLMVEVGGVEMPVISRKDLVANKLVADRPQDRADLARLRAADEDGG